MTTISQQQKHAAALSLAWLPTFSQERQDALAIIERYHAQQPSALRAHARRAINEAFQDGREFYVVATRTRAVRWDGRMSVISK